MSHFITNHYEEGASASFAPAEDNEISSSHSELDTEETPKQKWSTSAKEAAYDAELVRRFKEGDAGAFNEIVERHRKRIYFLAFFMLRNRSDAEEIAQDTFIRAHRNLGTFRCDSSLSTWLHRIATNLSRNRYWYHFRRKRYSTSSLDTESEKADGTTLSDLVPSPDASPDGEAVTSEFCSVVDTCMSRLAPSQREILLLRTATDHSYGEIARMKGINIGTVKSRIARARETLRSYLAEECPELTPDVSLAEWFRMRGAYDRMDTVMV